MASKKKSVENNGFGILFLIVFGLLFLIFIGIVPFLVLFLVPVFLLYIILERINLEVSVKKTVWIAYFVILLVIILNKIL